MSSDFQQPWHWQRRINGSLPYRSNATTCACPVPATRDRKWKHFKFSEYNSSRYILSAAIEQIRDLHLVITLPADHPASNGAWPSAGRDLCKMLGTSSSRSLGYRDFKSPFSDLMMAFNMTEVILRIVAALLGTCNSGSTLIQVMACCLATQRHYLKQRWIIIIGVMLRSLNSNLTLKCARYQPLR